jgi:hypothetical protein
MQKRLASPSDLALLPTSSRTALAYAAGAVASPICVALAVFSACVALGCAGIFGALVAMALVVASAAGLARYGFVRRHLDNQVELRERARRESQRLRQLRPAGPVRQQQYIELRALVETIERTDRTEAQRYELQDLLDHFVRLSATQQRCMEALRLAGSQDLPHAIPITDATRSRRRREIMQRRMRHRDECLARIDRITDELEALDELVRLVAQRVACPTNEGDLDREIERRLWELDEVDDALKQLTASA